MVTITAEISTSSFSIVYLMISMAGINVLQSLSYQYKNSITIQKLNRFNCFHLG